MVGWMGPQHVSSSSKRSLLNACVSSHWWRLVVSCGKCNTVASNHFHSVKILLFSSARSRDFDGMFSIGFRCQGTQYKLQSICAVLTFDPQLKKILTFSVKDTYQLNYFICIKDFNADNYFFKIKFVFFLYLLLSASWKKTICLYIFLISDR